MGRLASNRVFDLVHRVTVTGLIGLTGACTVMVGYFTYIHMTVVRPQRGQLRLDKQAQLLASEQVEKEKELIRRQRLAETLPA